jgi:hypothetical protein
MGIVTVSSTAFSPEEKRPKPSARQDQSSIAADADVADQQMMFLSNQRYLPALPRLEHDARSPRDPRQAARLVVAVSTFPVASGTTHFVRRLDFAAGWRIFSSTAAG